jgi:hypothetical protein
MTEHLIHLYNLRNRFAESLRWHVKYDFGAKFSDVKKNPPGGAYVDCSGYSRWLLYHGSDGGLMLPDGSWNQLEAIEEKGFSQRVYRNVLKDRTGAVYIAFFKPTRFKPGHVWLLQDGLTMESYGGHGIGSRKGLPLALMLRPIYCYRLS